jgi:hypothetical protein
MLNISRGIPTRRGNPLALCAERDGRRSGFGAEWHSRRQSAGVDYLSVEIPKLPAAVTPKRKPLRASAGADLVPARAAGVLAVRRLDAGSGSRIRRKPFSNQMAHKRYSI